MLWLCAFVGAHFDNPNSRKSADTQIVAPMSVARQLRGLGEEEANALLAKLQDAQKRLKAGDDKLVFELMAGSLACYEMTKVSAHDAFLSVPFDKVWNIERDPDQGVTKRYRLSYAPHGLGQVYWEIEVTVGFNDRIWRVAMVYKPPAPF